MVIDDYDDDNGEDDDDDDDDDDIEYLIQSITYQQQLHPNYNT